MAFLATANTSSDEKMLKYIAHSSNINININKASSIAWLQFIHCN